MRLRAALMFAALYALAPSLVRAQESDGDTDELIEESLDEDEPAKPAGKPSTDPASAKVKAKEAAPPHELSPGDALKPERDPAKREASKDRPLPVKPFDETAPSDEPGKGATQIAFPKDGAKPPPKDPPKDVQRAKEPKPKGEAAPKAAAAQVDAGRATSVLTEVDLKSAIEARARALRNGDQTGADAELQSILDIRHQLGARNVVIASASLIHEATEAQSVGRLEQAIELAEAAAKISPDLVAAHWLRMRLYAKRNWAQFDRIFASLGDLLSAKLSCFRNLVVLISNTLGVISLALFATIFGFTLIQSFKYMRYSAHDLVRILPSWLASGEGVMLLIIAILAPLVFGFGVALSTVLALGIVYPYQSPEERSLSKWSFGLLALTPVVIFALAPLVTFHGSIADAIDSASTEAFAYDAEAKLVEWEKGAGKNDMQAALVLARRYRMRGDLADAESEYRRALLAQPHNTVARNNLGTLLYIEGHEEQAKASFQMATSGSEIAEPYLNLASILLDGSNFDEANAAIEKARRLNTPLTELYTKFDSSVPTIKKLLDGETQDGSLWMRLMDVEVDQRIEVTSEVWHLIGGDTPWFAMPAVVLLIAAIAVLFGRRSDELKLSVACPKCGVPAERDAPARYCEQCQSIFLKGVAVEPSLRLEKETSVRNYQRRRRWTERGLAVIAGGGYLFGERPWLGAGILFAFLAMLANMLWTEGLISHPWSLGREASSSFVQLLASGLAAVALVVVSVRQAFK